MCRTGTRKGKIKLKKRLLSILLAAVMVLTMLPLGLVETAEATEDWLWPAENCYIVSSNYGARDLYGTGNYDNYHRGIDIIGANGTLGKPIRAAKSGTIYSRNASIADNTYVAGSMGNYVAINHGDGTYSVYMHMRPNGVASTGTVRQGDIIGYIGNTGDSYGAHLHFQIYTNPNNMSGSTLNPMPTNGNITIQNRYVLPSGWASEKTTYVFEVQPPAHTCDRGSYQYYEAAHPHYKNYKCSICGEIWRDTSDPTKVSSCEQCYPRTADITYYDADGFVWRTASVMANESYTLVSDYPTRSGSYFVGWAYTPETDDFDLRPDDTVTMKGNIDLYPVYVTHEQAVSGETVYIYDISDFDSTGYDVSSAQYTVSTRVDNSDWGSWSDYSFSSASASDTTQVETETLYRYYYYLCPSCGAHEPFKGTSDCGAQIPNSAWHDYWSTVPYSKSNRQTFSYTSSKYYTTSLGDGQLWCFSAGNLYDTALGTIDSGSDAVVIETGYRTRRWQTKYEAVERTVIGYQITESAIPTSGSCGENLTWMLEENGTLTISGMGRMQDYSSWIDTPWYSIRSQIKSVIIKNGVTSIGNMAFEDCEALTEVTIPDSVIEIGGLAFDRCCSLKGVNIPNSVTYIGGYAFASCSSLTSVTIPDSVHTICNSAFEDCSSLTSVMIPDSVTSIGWNAFEDCSALTEIKLPSALRVIPSETFSNCVRLVSVTIPKSVIHIEEKAFYYCESLTDVYYDGTAADWAKITVASGNDDMTNATLHCIVSAPAAPVVKIGNSASSGKPQLTWRAVYGATSYRIYRSTSKGSGYSLLGTTTATSYTNTGAKAGTTYYYRVKAVNDAGLSPYSNIVSGQVKTVTPKPAAPVVKIGNSATSGKPMLTWNAVSGATSYKVYRATSQNGTYSLLGTVTATSYTNTGAKAGTTYYYKVKAVNAAGESAYSNIVSGRATVTTLTMGHSAASGKPMLTWKAVSGAASYKVYRATTKNGAYSVINTTKALTYTNTGTALGTTYYYKVEALNSAGKSMGFSAIVEGKVAPVLAVGYSSVSGKPQLTWKAVPGATGYQVYRSTQQNSGYSKINTTTSISYVNTGAKANTTYYYRIVAVKGTAASDFSNIVSARPSK